MQRTTLFLLGFLFVSCGGSSRSAGSRRHSSVTETESRPKWTV